MRYHEFLRRVQSQAGISSQAETINLINVTLSALEEYMYRSGGNTVGVPTSGEIINLFRARNALEVTRREVSRFKLDDFYKRVNARVNLSYSQTVMGVQAVMNVLGEALGDD